MRIFVAGGTGVIGQQLLPRLVARAARKSGQSIRRRTWLSSSTVPCRRSACTHSWSITAE